MQKIWIFPHTVLDKKKYWPNFSKNLKIYLALFPSFGQFFFFFKKFGPVTQDFIWVSNTILKFRKNIQFQEHVQIEIGSFRLLPGSKYEWFFQKNFSVHYQLLIIQNVFLSKIYEYSQKVQSCHFPVPRCFVSVWFCKNILLEIIVCSKCSFRLKHFAKTIHGKTMFISCSAFFFRNFYYHYIISFGSIEIKYELRK